MLFKGVMTAIITPFKNGLFDENSFQNLIDWQIKNSVDAIVVCGTTGEAATVSLEEHERIIKLAKEACLGRVPVIAGCGSNSTANAVKLAINAKKAGADGSLQVTPYYNKPTGEGLYQHFKTIASMCDLPIILYNVPGRTSVNMLPETVKRLSEIDVIVGVKEASGNLEQIKNIIDNIPSDFGLYSGEDAQNLEIYKLGSAGAISVTANIVPKKVSCIWDEFGSGNIEEADKKQNELELLNKAMFIETNPIPVKTSLALMGYCKEEFRLPMTPISESKKQELIEVLKKYELI